MPIQPDCLVEIEEEKKIKRPWRWWRAKWTSLDGRPPVPGVPCQCDYVMCRYARTAPGPFPACAMTQLLGPIYPSEESARMKAEEMLALMGEKAGVRISFDGAVKTDEEGREI